jgi:general stress protein 26
MGEERRRRALEFARRVSHTCLATTMEDGTPSQRLMHWSLIDDDFNVWLATRFSSPKVRHIEANPRVSLMFVDEIGYVRVTGTAEIISDKAILAEFWKDEWELYWPGGPEDPDYRLVKVTSTSVDYLNMSDGDTFATPV